MMAVVMAVVMVMEEEEEEVLPTLPSPLDGRLKKKGKGKKKKIMNTLRRTNMEMFSVWKERTLIEDKE